MKQPLDTIDLLPCPFCESGDVGLRALLGNEKRLAVRCKRCEADGPAADTSDDATKLWQQAPRHHQVRRLMTDIERRVYLDPVDSLMIWGLTVYPIDGRDDDFAELACKRIERVLHKAIVNSHAGVQCLCATDKNQCLLHGPR